jgi:hypothetical protein
MSLVRVWTDVGERKPKALLAKIISHQKDIYTIKYLSPAGDSKNIFRYEDDVYEIDDESICEYLNVDAEAELGFKINDEGDFYKDDSDDDYVPSESGSESSCEDDDTDEFDEEEETEAEEEEEDDDE